MWTGSAVVSFPVSFEGVKAGNDAQAAKAIKEFLERVIGVIPAALKKEKGAFVMEEGPVEVDLDFYNEEEPY